MPSNMEPVHSPHTLVLAIPRLAEISGSKPSAPPTPVLKIPISTRVAPRRSSLIRVGENVWVSPRRIPRESPNSLPAPNPDGRSWPVGDEPSGKLLSLARELLSLLYAKKIVSEELIR